ncbi:hypothetical protein O3G_MSEX009841 [Manduca sexta]|uniref:Reverse transcriptase domain-containing protein n=1 Tax=Manduca sexta TaxID=7130 RepID=A0A921ZFK4_MANSE|nr:hypothetical protein O3G_MSEX009841 [Manduca sexta]
MNKCIQHSTCYQFADDTCLLIADKDPELAIGRLQSDLNSLARWCHDSGLVLNANKTKLLVIKSPYITLTSFKKKLVAHDHNCLHSSNCKTCQCPFIETVDRHMYLGVLMDSKFNWSLHIEYVCSNLRQFLANMKILSRRIPFKTKLMLYNTLAESYIQYGLLCYGRTFKTYVSRIYELQLKIIKTIVSTNVKPQYTHDEKGLFKHCKIMNIYSLIKYTLLKHYYFNTSVKSVIKHPIYTRAIAQNQLFQPSANNAYGERTANYIIPRLINNLPTDLIEKITPSNYKFKLKTIFLTNQ